MTTATESSSGRPAGEDKKRIAEIQARAEAAPPGPWRVVGADNWRLEGFPQVEYNDPVGSYICVHNDNDAAFIAHAREDIPFLLAALSSTTARAVRAEADAARWQFVKPFLSIDNEVDDPDYASRCHTWVQITNETIAVPDEWLGYHHDVDAAIDAARSASA